MTLFPSFRLQGREKDATIDKFGGGGDTSRRENQDRERNFTTDINLPNFSNSLPFQQRRISIILHSQQKNKLLAVCQDFSSSSFFSNCSIWAEKRDSNSEDIWIGFSKTSLRKGEKVFIFKLFAKYTCSA